MHQGDGADDVLAAAALAAFGKDGGYRAPRGDAGAVQAFSQHVPNLPFSAGRSPPGPRPAFSHAIPLPGKCRTPLAALHLPEKRGNEKNARAPQDTQIPWAQTPLSVWRIIIRTCGFVNGVLQFTMIKLSKWAGVLLVPAPFSNPGGSWYDRGNHFAKEGQLCFTPSCGTGTARS